MLVREDGAILSANRAAQTMLALKNAVSASLLKLGNLLEHDARTLHEETPDGGPFVVISCAGRVDGIAESALFQAAVEARPELHPDCEREPVRRPARCTLLLDEVEAMPQILQTRLLRAFKRRSVLLERDAAQVAVDVRVVSASRCDLLPLVRSGHFCQDLYARLADLTLTIPALKDQEGREALVDPILSSLAQGNDQPCTVSAAARQRLGTYHGPGNLRQLRHALQVASILAGPGHVITADMLGEELFAAPPSDVHQRTAHAPSDSAGVGSGSCWRQ